MDIASFLAEYRRELHRIGLNEDESPYGAMAGDSHDAVAQFLTHLRSLPAGATWRDVFPDIPPHWDLDDDTTWTYPYEPLGPFDYQTLPCGPALLLGLPRASTVAHLEQITADAGVEGWRVYGSGFVHIANPDWPDRLAYVVLSVETTEADFDAFGLWLTQRGDCSLAAVTRPVGAQFAP